MRLSDAVVLGDSLKTRKSDSWLNRECTHGCAVGGAMLAIGRWSADRFSTELPAVQQEILAAWPWLADGGLTSISLRFAQVCHGDLTFEGLVAFIKAIEPDCDCNQRGCFCKAATPIQAPVAEMQPA